MLRRHDLWLFFGLLANSQASRQLKAYPLWKTAEVVAAYTWGAVAVKSAIVVGVVDIDFAGKYLQLCTRSMVLEGALLDTIVVVVP